MVGGHSTVGDKIDGVFDAFGVVLALLGRFLGVSDGVAVFELGVRFMLDLEALDGAIGGFSTSERVTVMRQSVWLNFDFRFLTINADTRNSYAHWACFAHGSCSLYYQTRISR
jgi:hypothetical protein